LSIGERLRAVRAVLRMRQADAGGVWQVILQIVRNSNISMSSPAARASMYICLCNALTDRQIRAQCEGEDASVAMVYRALGAAPQCGKCVPMVRQILRQSAGASPGLEAGDD
jgi:bacterioferritin-associated ferredoxin